MNFIDLQRRFQDLTNEEFEDTELFVSLDEQGFGPSVGWPELLKHHRVILLAEAGAGKTKEMREQKNRLVGEDQFAFFLPLASLDRESILDLLSVDDGERFKVWKAGGQEPAWFFLDSVDELKLNAGQLDRALNRLSNAINGHFDRARVIISCRPGDWRPSVELV